MKIGLTSRLWKEHVRIHRPQLFKALGCMVTAAIATAAFPYFLKPACDFVFHNNDRFSLVFFCACIFLSFLIKGLASFGEAFIMTSIGQRIVFDIQERLFCRLMHCDIKFFDEHHGGDILSRFSSDVSLMRSAVSTVLSVVGKDILTFILLATLMFCRDSTLATFSFIGFPAALVPIILLGQKMKRIVANTQNDLGTFLEYLSQVFQGIRLVKVYGAEEAETKRASGKIGRLRDLTLKSMKTKAMLHPVLECIVGSAIMCVLMYGGIQVMDDNKTVGDLLSFLSALLISYEPIRKLTQFSATMQEGFAAAKRIFEIIDAPTEIQDPSEPVPIQCPVKSIEFRSVSFCYRPDKKILDNVSFKVKAGQVVAFVGENGAGKSTLMGLIPRFYDTTCGEILMNNINIKNIALNELREQISIVTQENILFDASFYDNIAYGKKSATMDEVTTAAKRAFANEFILATRDGYDTIIGENGARISGGQRQRIAIARAILKNAPILLLDEATSSLDTNSEKIVQRALVALMKNRTTIIIAHRLSSIVGANMIYVLEDGVIRECGNHKKLLSLNGLYNRLWHAQNLEK